MNKGGPSRKHLPSPSYSVFFWLTCGSVHCVCCGCNLCFSVAVFVPVFESGSCSRPYTVPVCRWRHWNVVPHLHASSLWHLYHLHHLCLLPSANEKGLLSASTGAHTRGASTRTSVNEWVSEELEMRQNSLKNASTAKDCLSVVSFFVSSDESECTTWISLMAINGVFLSIRCFSLSWASPSRLQVVTVFAILRTHALQPVFLTPICRAPL